MRKAARQIAVCMGILILFCLACRLTVSRNYYAYIPLYGPQEEALRQGATRVVENPPGVVRLEGEELHPGYLRLALRAVSPGEAMIEIRDADGEQIITYFVRVGLFRTLIDKQTGGFTGDTAVLIAVTVFWLLLSAIMLWHYFQAKGPAYYAYSTIYYVGFSLFSLITGLVMLQVTVFHLFLPAQYSMLTAYSTINGASKRFMALTMPVMLLFALAMAVSNIALLRHERPRLQNMLGLAVSILLLAGEAVGMWLFTRDFMGSEWEGRVRTTLENVYATVFAYFEYMLAGSVICGIQAARRQPAPDRDGIIILGCWFRPDGTLPPLLKGRVDRALAFWRRQKEETGKEALLIPSGGQGRDEPMAEGEAMARYLVAQGVPESVIYPETQAKSTYQNMANSKQILSAVRPGGKAVFATTNYHVFRSGLWAAQAGLDAEGIGGKTKWWFWPNAFMRECAGLLQKRWKQELLLLCALVAFFSALSLTLG